MILEHIFYLGLISDFNKSVMIISEKDLLMQVEVISLSAQIGFWNQIITITLYIAL